MSRRQRRRLVIAAVSLAVVVTAALVFIGQTPSAQPTPSPSPEPTLQPTAQPTDSPLPSPTDASTASPRPTLTPRPTGEPSPAAADTGPPPTPRPSPAAAGPAAQREFRLLDVGLDRQGLDEAAPRLMTVELDGPGTLELELLRVSIGSVRVCSWSGGPADSGQAQCHIVRRGGLHREIGQAGRSSWTFSLIGADALGTPSVSLALRFPAREPAMTLTDFRAQGRDLEGYNGFTAEFEAAAAGTLGLAGSIGDSAGGQYPFRVELLALASGEQLEAQGTGGSIEFEAQLEAGGQRLSLENTQGVALEEVMLQLRLSWP